MSSKMIKFLCGPLFVIGMAISFNANAWFFFFLPGSATRAIGDAITGAKGNICVKDTAKVGDTLTSPAGNTAKILSLSGTSSQCANPALPIRAELEYSFTFNSKAGLDLPDDFEPTTLTDLQRFNGTLLIGKSKTLSNKGVNIRAVARTSTTNIKTLANNLEVAQIAIMKEAKGQNSEQLKINGMNALRFEVVGTLKGIFGQDETYQITILEGTEEYVVVNVYIPTSDYAAQKMDMQKIATTVSGLAGSTNMAPAAAANPTLETAVMSTEKVSEPAANNPAPAPITAAPVPAPSSVSAAQRLEDLNALLKKGLITQKDYDAKKAQILQSM